MGSESSLRLPIIDFSEIIQLKSSPAAADDHQWNSVRAQVMEALEEYGCFEVVYDCRSVDSYSELHEQQLGIYAAVKEVFNLPLETKLKNMVPGKPNKGYSGQHPKTPLFESMAIDEPHILENAKSFTRTLWPEGNANICKALHSFTKQALELDQMVRRMILESLGVEKYYNEHIESTKYVLRLLKYKGPETNEAQTGLRNHRDMNMVTILSQNEVDGLEVQTKTGEWIKVKPSPHSFTVMIGEAMMAWTNGRLNYPPPHQVMMTGDETRYATGLFSIPRADYLVRAPEELVDEEHPLLYKPYNHEEYMAHLLKLAYERSKLIALKDFCGV